MLRRTLRIFAVLPVQPAMAVPLAQSATEADQAVRHLYGSRWLGAKSDYLAFEKPQAHFVPFYLAEGKVDAVYSAVITYTERRTNSKGKLESVTYHRTVAPRGMEKRFYDHDTQVYAGYRRDPKHVQVLGGEHIPTVMKPLDEVDVAAADDMNQIEMSLTTLKDELKELLMELAETKAKNEVSHWHSGSDSIQIEWHSFNMRVATVTPVFLSAWIVPLKYGDNEYRAVVDGIRANVSGPRLYNPELVGRLSAGGALVGTIGLARAGALAVFGPAFPLAIIASMLASYYGAFYAATSIPNWRIQYRKRMQEARREANKNARSSSSSSSSTGSSGASQKRAQHMDDGNDDANSHPNPQDPKGYYRLLGVAPQASVNEVKAAYRKQALKLHPDVAKGRGKPGQDMATLNVAYQVLRNRKRRKAYDSGDKDA